MPKLLNYVSNEHAILRRFAIRQCVICGYNQDASRNQERIHTYIYMVCRIFRLWDLRLYEALRRSRNQKIGTRTIVEAYWAITNVAPVKAGSEKTPE